MPTARGPVVRLLRLALGALVAAALALSLSAPLAASLATPVVPPPGRAEKLLPCQFEGAERIVAVGDVHGAYDRYVEILGLAGVLDAQKHWAGGRTHLVQLGDMVDRGGDSLKVLDLLRDLDEPARRAGGAVHVLLGNHEVMRMLGDLRYVSAGEYKAFVNEDSEDMRRRYLGQLSGEDRARIGVIPLGFVEMRIAFGQNGEYGRWLLRLDTVIRVNEVLFVHGGLSPDVAKKSCKEINDTVRRQLTSDLDKTRAAPLESLVAGKNGPLWYRGLATETDEFTPKVDEVLKAQGAKALVIGHTVQGTGRIEKRFGGKVVAIDTGMQPEYATGGRASALEIKDGVFTAIYTDKREVLLEPQK